jgi:hypothetical protein
MTATLLLAIFKSIPALYKMYEASIGLYYKQQSASDEERYSKKKATRDALISAMETPGKTYEELKELRRSLYDLNR